MQISSRPTPTAQLDETELDIDTLADIFKALSDPNRLRIVFALLGAEQGQNVGQTAGCCEIDLSVVSRHLSILRRSGILTREKQGKQVIYRVDQTNLPIALRTMADTVESCCQPSAGKPDTNGESTSEARE
ncbi:MAG: winged helix-turn-helix transcriptional regulator [Fidelibacterota bacterium]|nr:MAG: winged helix-turn-helix transcriptional regulator [Candidatus Neomarinimicrobiota bacterium]